MKNNNKISKAHWNLNRCLVNKKFKAVTKAMNILYNESKWYDIKMENAKIDKIIVKDPSVISPFCISIVDVKLWFQYKRRQEPGLTEIGNMIERFMKFEKKVIRKLKMQ